MRTWLVAARGNATQAEVARKAKISQNYYSCIENGERRPSVDVAKRIADALGVDWTRFYVDE